MIIRFFRIILFLTLFAGVSCATRDHNDVLPSNEEANLCIVPEPKEYLQIGKKKHKLKEVNYDTKTVFTDPDEYRIVIKRGKATITGNAVWAQSTLNQLVDANGKVADCEIHDWAAYPQLNDPQYQRKGRDEGKYYTYDEIREVIAYAKERGITVVPEIDMPGHSTFFKDAFSFTMDSEEGRKVLETCLAEFCCEIPKSDCPYFHIGSDEVWIADPNGFMQWIEDLMEQLDRQPIVWDPGLPASDNVVRQIWNEAAGSNAAASEKAGKYLDSFVGYLNYYDPMLFTSRLFLHTAAAQTKPDTSQALGGILCLWNDVRVDNKENIALHNGMVNGMMAFAERFWNGGNAGVVENENLPPGPHTEAGSRLADFEKKMALHRDRFHKGKMRWVANSQVEWLVKIDENEAFAAFGGAVDLDAFCQVHQMVTGDTALAVAQTVFIAEHDMDIEAWIGFCTPARSNRNGYGIGAQGHWEGGCRCFVNGTEILPPLPWNEPGKYDYHFNTWGKPEEEEPFTDEQLYWMRRPAKLHLTKGENHVEIRVPKTYKGLRWSFAFIPVCIQPDGSVCEVKGLKIGE